MKSLKTGHWLILGFTALIIVLLLIAPHHSDSELGIETTANADADPPDVEFRIDSALKIIASETPMQGIMQLREIAEEYPDNFRAQYHMGLFSVQTLQWEKVIERFEILQKIDPTFAESEFWIGKAQLALGDTNVAKMHMVRFLANEKESSQLTVEAEKMLNQIK